jgi:hypothetical protein
MGRNSSVGIATRYGMVGPGIESRWQRNFPHPSGTTLGSNQPPIPWVPGIYRGESDQSVALTTTPTSTEVKERVRLYIYSPYGPSWPIRGCTLPLLYLLLRDSVGNHVCC